MPQTVEKRAAPRPEKQEEPGRKVYEPKPETAPKLSRAALRKSLMARTSKTMDLLAK
jgi:hypothetical protein